MASQFLREGRHVVEKLCGHSEGRGTGTVVRVKRRGAEQSLAMWVILLCWPPHDPQRDNDLQT